MSDDGFEDYISGHYQELIEAFAEKHSSWFDDFVRQRMLNEQIDAADARAEAIADARREDKNETN